MANALNLYNPLFYANEALIQLENALGMAGRVHRGYDKERGTFSRGETINISRPGTFTAQNAPSSAQDLTPDNVAITLSEWKEVKFGLTDKELAFTGQQIIDDHIRPAAYALADNVDAALALQYKSVPNVANFTADVAGITGIGRKQFDLKVPTYDQNHMHFMINGSVQEALLAVPAFTQYTGAGDLGTSSQVTGNLGKRFGYNFFANQNVQLHTTTAMTLVGTVAVVGAQSKGAISLTIDAATTMTGGTAIGDTFVIAGSTQRYAITTASVASGNAITVGITPPLVQAYADNAVVTFDQSDTGKAQNIAFHRNFAALAMAKLPTIGDGLGAKIATVQDPRTGLALRARMFYEGNNSKVFVALDILYGVKVLDGNLAMRARITPT